MKFLDRGKVKTLDEAMKMLIDNHFKGTPRPRPGLPPPQSGQDFRERYAWRSDMDDLLRSNMPSILELYKYFADQVKPGGPLKMEGCLLMAPVLDLPE